MAKAKITIYHNPRCQTSRNVLGLIRESGAEPEIIEYLKSPPSRAELQRLVKRMGARMRDVVRWKEPLANKLGLDKEKSSETQLPIVATGDAVKLCRPSETVSQLL